MCYQWNQLFKLFGGGGGGGGEGSGGSHYSAFSSHTLAWGGGVADGPPVVLNRLCTQSYNIHHVSGHLCIIKSVPNLKSLKYYDLYEGYNNIVTY